MMAGDLIFFEEVLKDELAVLSIVIVTISLQ